MAVSSAELDSKCPEVTLPARETTAIDKGILVFNRDPELRLFLNKALYLGDVLVTWAQSREQVHAGTVSGEVGASRYASVCSRRNRSGGFAGVHEAGSALAHQFHGTGGSK